MAGRSTFLAPGQRYADDGLVSWRSHHQLTAVQGGRVASAVRPSPATGGPTMCASVPARLSAALGVALLALALCAGAGGRTAAAEGGGALHYEGFRCWIVGPFFLLVATDARITATPSGNSNLVCHFDTGTGPEPAMVVDGFRCTTADQDGTWQVGTGHFVWTPSGKATATCTFHPD